MKLQDPIDVTTSPFWEHLNGLALAYKTLEMECHELRSSSKNTVSWDQLCPETIQLEVPCEEDSVNLPIPTEAPFPCEEDSVDLAIPTEAPAAEMAQSISGKRHSQMQHWLDKGTCHDVLVDCDRQKISDKCVLHCAPPLASFQPGTNGHEFQRKRSDESAKVFNAPLDLHFEECFELDSSSSSQETSSSEGSQMEMTMTPLVRWGHLVYHVIKTMTEYSLRPSWSEARHSLMFLDQPSVNRSNGSRFQDPIMQEWAGLNKKILGIKTKKFSQFTVSQSEQRHTLTRGMTRTSMIGQSRGQGRLPSFLCSVVHPLSTTRLIWSLLGIVFVACDGALLSLAVFQPLTSDPVVVIEWSSRFFWALDIVISFRTGFYIKGKYENRPKAIAREYTRTWLAVDIVALVPDVVLALLFSGNSNRAFFTTLRWLKVFKVLRLMRFAKSAAVIRTFLDSLNSINAVLMFHILKYFCLVICWVHLVGCAWYAVGKEGRSKDTSWIIKAGVESFELPKSYIVSVQWALSLLQGGTDVYPSFSVKEGAFAISTITASIFILAVFISNVTNMLIQLQTSWDEKARQMRALQEYLYVHRVSANVAKSVRNYAQEKLKIERKLHLDEHRVTEFLPTAVRRALLVEVRGPMVTVKHPVFLAIQRVLPKCFEKLCCDLLVPSFISPDTLVYNYGEKSSETYFILAGEIFYDHISNRALKDVLDLFGAVRSNPYQNMDWLTTSLSPAMFTSSDSSVVGLLSSDPACNPDRVSKATSRATSKSKWQHFHLQKAYLRERLRDKATFFASTELKQSQPVCESTLWTHWTHLGDLYAASHAAFLTLEADAFSVLATHEPKLNSICACQAIRFCRVLNCGEWVASDLLTSGDVLSFLHHEEREMRANRYPSLFSMVTSSESHRTRR